MIVEKLMKISIFSCFLASIWGPDHLKWLLSAIYMIGVYKFIFKKTTYDMMIDFTGRRLK